ncbi:MAG TPA: hypothetical protein VMW41_02555 [Candidatus Bathyarchaeia archaeon]|nr:hypothetical protein [Candidatus Bathyarchaeia archaeon]
MNLEETFDKLIILINEKKEALKKKEAYIESRFEELKTKQEEIMEMDKGLASREAMVTKEKIALRLKKEGLEKKEKILKRKAQQVQEILH